MAGNVFLKGAKPSKNEKDPLVLSEFDPAVKFIEKADGCFLDITFDKSWTAGTRQLVTTALLGKTKIAGLPYENADGSPLTIDRDFFGKQRNKTNPTVGPFENPGEGPVSLKMK